MKNSFKHAFRGLIYSLEESTFRIMFAIALVVAVLAIALGVTSIEASILVLTVTVVLGFEFLNTQIEQVFDILEPRANHRIGIIKDVSAAAVLIASIGAVIIGLIIFLPYLI